MKKSVSFITALLYVQLATAQLFSDNFDSYALGSFIGPQSNNWTTWSGAQGGVEDVTTTNNQAATAPHSLYFSSTASGGGPQDVVLDFGQIYNSGIFTLNADFYVDATKGAYLNLQGLQTLGAVTPLVIHMEHGQLFIGGEGFSPFFVCTYPEDTWFDFEIEANLTSHLWKLYLNNQEVCTWVNSINTLAAADFYPLLNNQFYVDNVNFDHNIYSLPTLNAMVLSQEMGGAIAGQTVNPTVEIYNSGQNAITSFSVVLNYNGMFYSQNVTGVNILSTESYNVSMPALNLVAGLNNSMVTIYNINGGNDDNLADNTLTQEVNPVIPAVGKIVVCELATGTWSDNCPRGAVFMEKYDTEFNGFWAGIAAHTGDPMAEIQYAANFASIVTSYPEAAFDRSFYGDIANMSSTFYDLLQIAPKGVLTNGATWDPTTRLLNVSVSTEMLQATTGSYKVACVLTEDGVTGTGSGYNQSNAYAGGNNGVMGGFESLPNPVPAAQMVYDHVARAIAPSFMGQTGVIAASTAVGDNYTANFSFTLPTTWDETQMHIVGLLIDPQGKIDNAGYTTIDQAVANGYVGLQESISAVYLEQMLTVAPNPATDFTNITLHIPNDAQVSVRILDAKGGILQARQFGSLQGDFEIGLNTSNYAPGLYIVEMEMNGQRTQKKLVIR